MSLPARPNDAVALFERLARWGEVSAYEAEELGAVVWVSVFEDAGVLNRVHDDRGLLVAWHLKPSFVHLLDLDEYQVGRRLCFAVPAYRGYLLGILAEGLVDAARASMTAELEEWTRAELAALLPELNAFFELLEDESRVVDLAPAELETRVARFPGRAGAFTAWDAFALGQSAPPKALFPFVLRHFAPSSEPLRVFNERAAVLRPLPLNREDRFNLGEASLPHPWNARRYGVLSGVAVVDAHGQLLFDEDQPLDDVLIEHLRDAVVKHPFYAAVVHLAICAWRSPASTMSSVELYVPGALHDTSVLLDARGVGRLGDLLGDLVRAQGYAPFGLVDRRVGDDLMGNLLRNLLELRILRRKDELLVLDDDYQSTLMSTRLRSVFRPGKELQRRMVEELAARTPFGEPS